MMMMMMMIIIIIKKTRFEEWIGPGLQVKNTAKTCSAVPDM